MTILPNAEEINRKIRASKKINALYGRVVRPKEVRAAMSSVLKSFNGTATVAYSELNFGNTYTITGSFWMSDVPKPIELELMLGKGEDSIDFRYHSVFEEFVFSFSSVIQHEMIHQLQYQKNSGNTYPHYVKEKKRLTNRQWEAIFYLSDPDELEAHAHDLAMEIIYYYPKHDPWFILSTISKRRKLQTYKLYKKAFQNTDWRFVKQRLLKKTNSYLSSVSLP